MACSVNQIVRALTHHVQYCYWQIHKNNWQGLEFYYYFLNHKYNH